jgi:hypothetical protein
LFAAEKKMFVFTVKKKLFFVPVASMDDVISASTPQLTANKQRRDSH